MNGACRMVVDFPSSELYRLTQIFNADLGERRKAASHQSLETTEAFL